MASPVAEDAPGHYNNSHCAFLQAVLARSTITFEEAKPVLAAIMTAQENRPTLPNDITFADFNNFINTINAAIHDFDYEIRYTYPQNAPSRTQESAVYAVVNMSSDPATQLATTHSPDEISFVKRVLDAMFETHNRQSREVMAVKGMEAASNLCKPPRNRESNISSTNGDTQGQATQSAPDKGITVVQAEKVLEKMVDEGWFMKSRAGYLSLTPRALMELRGWLVESYNEEPDDEDEGPQWQRIKMCEACRDIVTVGQRCANRECNCRLHDFCTTAFFRTQSERKCPTCKTEWTSNNFVGERAARGAVAPASRHSTAGASASTSRTRPVSIPDDEDSSD
ncbi:hypothetical protein EJ08DRAFT_401337 [Tothia fuscella]|uniref:Non-structural maintenance of chromosomes element 1 homolog n=1 Tax=Tothia fuscella TaxID=1048955 RepID=A0A9P4NKK4_9PEZI|nr:hypothetical protein EJ08DRAFT_401337 [Tothia fuscella]